MGADQEGVRGRRLAPDPLDLRPRRIPAAAAAADPELGREGLADPELLLLSICNMGFRYRCHLV
jgi:hypothetical protein